MTALSATATPVPTGAKRTRLRSAKGSQWRSGAEELVRGVGCPGFNLSLAHTHDVPQLALDQPWRGLGLLFELGYASFALLNDAERLNVQSIIRL